MYFVLHTPSLQHLATVKTVVHLWNQHDVFTYFHSPSIPINSHKDDVPKWQTIIDKVEVKIRCLPLPERCKNQLLDLIKPLGTEIIHWCEYHRLDDYSFKYSYSDNCFPNQLCWTMHGSIDYKRTAELMVKNERVDLQKRFELACINCLEDEARKLFQRVAQERGEEWVPILRYVRRFDLSRFILFFTRSINLDVRSDSTILASELSINKRLLEISLCSSNRAMGEYLFRTLKQAEKKQVLEDCGRLIERCHNRYPTCNLLYYLSLMNEEQQERMFQKCTGDVLICLLQWPMQSLFVEAAKCGWQFIDSRNCSEVLFNIIRKIRNGFNDYCYSHLFWEFWSLCPADYIQVYLKEFKNLMGLLYTKQENFIKLIFKEAPLHHILTLCHRNDKISHVLMDESVMSDAALMECKQTAALKSSNDRNNVEKRLRSKHVSKLVDVVMKNRKKRRDRAVRREMRFNEEIYLFDSVYQTRLLTSRNALLKI